MTFNSHLHSAVPCQADGFSKKILNSNQKQGVKKSKHQKLFLLIGLINALCREEIPGE